jgi:hypothetical protein
MSGNAYQEKRLIELIKNLEMEKDIPDSLHTPLHMEKEAHPLLSPQDGYIECRNGYICVTDAQKSGRQPALLPSPNMDIFVDGKKISTKTVVTSRSVITWKVVHPLPYRIIISEDKLTVFLQLDYSFGKKYVLQDSEPRNIACFSYREIDAEYDVNAVCSLIVNDLFAQGIKAKIDTTVIYQELQNPTYKKVAVACGTPAVPSQDGRIELYFSKTTEKVLQDVGGRVDFRNHTRIPTVEAGETIARIFPPVPGVEGCDVFGHTLFPKNARRVEARARKHVEITEDGRVIAKRGGRPTVVGRQVKYFEILPSHYIEGDVDIKTGNIFFSGDVIVTGDVKENMRVEALGDVHVYGNVFSSTIIATGNVYIKGTVFNSALYGGHHGVFYIQIYMVLQNIYTDIEQIKYAMQQLQQQVKINGLSFSYGRMLSLLLEKRFASTRENISRFQAILHEIKKAENLSMELYLLSRQLFTLSKPHEIQEVESEQLLHSIQYGVKEVIQRIEMMVHEQSDVVLKSGQLTTIKTNGTIHVTGQGLINCTVFAGKDCLFHKEHSALRGGRMEASGQILLHEAGSRHGDSPILMAGKKVRAYKIWGAKIWIGKRMKLLTDPVERVEFTLTENNEIETAYF